MLKENKDYKMVTFLLSAYAESEDNQIYVEKNEKNRNELKNMTEADFAKYVTIISAPALLIE